MEAANHPKIVTSAHYHVWTDALHARALAHQAGNRWDRGTYVRWAVTTAWTVLEISCQDATGSNAISYSFRRELDNALASLAARPLNWGSGIWQRVTELQNRRKSCVHRLATEIELFPEAVLADEAIAVVRDAVKAIYNHVQRNHPTWIDDDRDRGWQTNRGGAHAHVTSIHAGADPDDGESIRLCYVASGVEYTAELLPPDTDWEPSVDALVRRITIPVSAIRVYRGHSLVNDIPLPMRGT